MLLNGDIISEPQHLKIEQAQRNGWDTTRISSLYNPSSTIELTMFMRGETARCVSCKAMIDANGIVRSADYFINGKPFKRSEVNFHGEGKSFYYDPYLVVEREVIAYLDGFSDQGAKTVVNATKYNSIFASPTGLAISPSINAFA
jgi:hypothetical protein